MKKISVLLAMSILSIALCACSEDSEAQRQESDSKNESEKRQEEVIEQEVEKAEESKEAEVEVETGVETEVAVVEEESFECLPEILNASFEEGLMQIDDMIIQHNFTMTLNDFVTLVQNSGSEYTIKIDEKEYNPNRLIGSDEWVVMEVFKNGEVYFHAYFRNITYDTVSLDSEKMILFSLNLNVEGQKAVRNSYLLKGIRMDGNGLTYGTVKEMFKDYEEDESMYIDENGGEEPDGEPYILMSVQYRCTPPAPGYNAWVTVWMFFRAEDGSCYKVKYV